MKKIGIITFHRATNYGAVLQGFALQKKLEQIKYQSEIIDYRNEYFERIYGIQKDFNTNNPLKKIVYFLCKNYFFIQKKIKFRKFIKENICISNKIYKSEINTLNSRYDYFITGSDQVFNLDLTQNDLTYYLDFCDDNKRFSYAASFGHKKILDEEMSDYKKLLSTFSKLSIRENDTSKLINEKLNLNTRVDIDPTLLFSRKQWDDLLNLKKCCLEEGIFYYKVAEPVKLTKYVSEFSEHNNKFVVEINSNLRKSSKEFIIKRTLGPKEFVEMIKKSEYVATTSFHATVFALLYHKKLILELKDINGKINNRVINLLNSVGIVDLDVENVVLLNNINWDRVDEKLKYEREKSISYLNSF
ncbi:MAG: polysaccharide pyruvyl transferase family protein [Methanobacteriaceae archaeon]|nr:polysaccharide pyruvyl transferase family protein [Methanobacteriaceae archaeon]